MNREERKDFCSFFFYKNNSSYLSVIKLNVYQYVRKIFATLKRTLGYMSY